jgi:phage recombination protein Bet
MNAIAKVGSGAVAQYTPDQIELIKRTICKGGTDDELQLFMYQCARTGLDALARQIYAVKRWDSQQNREVMGVQVSIDGFRLVAERSGHYAGQLGPFWCGEDGNWQDVWLSSKSPSAARVGVLRDDFKEPCWGVARFDAYASKKKGGDLTLMWATKGDIMIAKCAEALALRKAFPQELSGLYTSDEMEQATPAQDAAASNGKDKPVPPPVPKTDADILAGMRNWVDQQKDIIIELSDMDSLENWLKKHASCGGREGNWDRPTPSSPLDKILKFDPKLFNELKKYYLEKLVEI